MISYVKLMRLFILLVLPLVSVLSAAEGFDDEFDEKPWAEIEVQLPAFPENEDLISFRVGAIDDTQYLVDGKSVSVGADGVIRYTLAVVSSTGAKSISYEGLRCATGERRFYAFGRSDRTWSKARSNQWLKIQGGSNNHHVELMNNFFCTVGISPVGDVDGALRVLRSGGNARK